MKQELSKPTTPKRGPTTMASSQQKSGVNHHSKYLLPSEKLITSRNKKDDMMRKTMDVAMLKTELKKEILTKSGPKMGNRNSRR